MSDDSTLQERDPVADHVFRMLLDLYMAADPWPLSDKQSGMMLAFLTAESSKRGYGTWVEAYHDFDPEADE